MSAHFDTSNPTPSLDLLLEEVQRLRRAYDLLLNAHIYCLGPHRYEEEATRIEMDIADFFGSAP